MKTFKSFRIFNNDYIILNDKKYKIDKNKKLQKCKIEKNKINNSEILKNINNFINEIRKNPNYENSEYSLTHEDINGIMDKFKNDEFLGVFLKKDLKDVFKKLIKKNIKKFNFILNIKNHYQSFYFDFIDDYEINYYDPLAEKIPYILEKFIYKQIKIFKPPFMIDYFINKKREMRINSGLCGWYQVIFLLRRYKGLSFKKSLFGSDLNNNNEEIKNDISKFIKNKII